MDRPLFAWALLLLRLALVFGPALLFGTLWPEANALLPVLLLYSVAPLGVIALAVALVLFLATLLRR
jgi:hypothetical protein